MHGSDTLQLFGVHLLGINAQTGHKLALTVAFVAAAWIVGLVLRRALAFIGTCSERFGFWSQQVTAVVPSTQEISLCHTQSAA